MGWGLRVREEVRAGTLVCEYVGEIITEAQMRVSALTCSTEVYTRVQCDYYRNIYNTI